MSEVDPQPLRRTDEQSSQLPRDEKTLPGSGPAVRRQVADARAVVRALYGAGLDEVSCNSPSAVETTAPRLCTHKAEKVQRGYERGYDMAWCLECGGITWCSDAALSEEESKRNDYTAWLNMHLSAWSCRAEAEGRGKCERWCGHHSYCTAALRSPAKASTNQEISHE